MKIGIPTPFPTMVADFWDGLVPDSVRSGDAYDLMSGRAATHFMLSFNPLFTPKNETTVRRARAQDLTTSGLGFELLISHEGELHNALVHLPPADHVVWQSGELPVVIDSHGYTDAPRRHSKRSQIPESVVNEGAIAISLGGSRGATKMPLWDPLRSHDGMKAPGQLLRDKDGPALVEQIFDGLAAQVQAHADEAGIDTDIQIDREHSLAVGLSNGGALASLLAASGTVSGAISFSGPTSPVVADLDVKGPVSMIFVEGFEDKIVPIDGSGSPDYLVAEEAVQPFLARNGRQRLSSSHLPEFLKRWVQPGVDIKAVGGAKGPTVAIVRIEEHGHSVPGSDPMIPGGGALEIAAGLRSSEAVSGAQLVADFLRHHLQS